LLERLLELDVYKSEASQRVVKLTNNYRSHPEIFKYSNETFYASSMESMVSTDIHNFAKGWNQLPNPNIPIVFHSVEAESVEVKEYDGVSKFNIEEVEQVFDYVEYLIKNGLPEAKKITMEQIGVASPYTAQVEKIRGRLGMKYGLIDVGTSEFFQGREKSIMIISAVRTNTNVGLHMDSPRVRRLKDSLNDDDLKLFNSASTFC
jgi:superfamily I DNA and/or RNA helicase